MGKPNLEIELAPEALAVFEADSRHVRWLVMRAIDEHRRLVASQDRLVLKNAPESSVSLTKFPGVPSLCVKEFRWRGIFHGLKGLLRPTQGLRTLRNGRSLAAKQIPVAKPLALVRDIRLGVARVEWIVMEVLAGALELDRYILARAGLPWRIEEKRDLARQLGTFIGYIHSRGVFHSDLKTCNIMVTRQGQSSSSSSGARDPDRIVTAPHLKFFLVDYDNVTFSGHVLPRHQVKNLVQIFLSTPLLFDACDRLRFLRAYASKADIGASRRREIARRVYSEVLGKEILFVGPDGDVRETWNQ